MTQIDCQQNPLNSTECYPWSYTKSEKSASVVFTFLVVLKAQTLFSITHSDTLTHQWQLNCHAHLPLGATLGSVHCPKTVWHMNGAGLELPTLQLGNKSIHHLSHSRQGCHQKQLRFVRKRAEKSKIIQEETNANTTALSGSAFFFQHSLRHDCILQPFLVKSALMTVK